MNPCNIATIVWTVAFCLSISQFASAAPPTQLSSAEMQVDYDLMRAALEEAHGGLYRYSTKVQMDDFFAVQRAKLDRPLSKREFLGIAAEVVAGVKCGHTRLAPDDETRGAIAGTRLFPLRVLIEGEKLMVLSNDTADDRTIVPGMEIIEINGRKPGEILQRVFRVVPADNDVTSSKRMRAQREFAGYYWMLIEQPDEFVIAARDADGKTVTATLPGVTETQRSANQNPVNERAKAGAARRDWSPEKYALRFLGADAANVRLRTLSGNDFGQWVDRTFQTLREKEVKTLILDMRGNGGGRDEDGAYLLAHLVDKPFRYFDRVEIKTLEPSFRQHTDWNGDLERFLRERVAPAPGGGYLATGKLNTAILEQRPAANPFLGKLFILTDGATFSMAADFCAVTHRLGRATFIGEETGGGYYGNTAGPLVALTLPNSKLRVRIPLFSCWSAKSADDASRQGTRPDHVVETRVSAILDGADPQLDLALKLAGSGEAAPPSQ